MVARMIGSPGISTGTRGGISSALTGRKKRTIKGKPISEPSKTFVTQTGTVTPEEFKQATIGKEVIGEPSAPRAVEVSSPRVTSQIQQSRPTGIVSVSTASQDNLLRQPTSLERETSMSLSKGQQRIILQSRISELQKDIASRRGASGIFSNIKEFGKATIGRETKIAELIRRKRQAGLELTGTEKFAEIALPVTVTTGQLVAFKGAGKGLGLLSKSTGLAKVGTAAPTLTKS
jgi:hypothetical protein